MDIYVSFRNRKWNIKINKCTVLLSTVANHLGMKPATLRNNLSKVSNKAGYLKELYWRKETNTAPTMKIYKRDGVWCSQSCVLSMMPELSPNTIQYRLRKWELGELDLDDVYRPLLIETKPKSTDCALDWEGLSSKVRNHNLHKIPSPTPLERSLY